MSKPFVVPIPLGFVWAFLIIQDDRALLVDTGLAGSASRILHIAAKHGIAPRMIKLIILTHAHTDHTGSALTLQDKCQSLIALHPLEAQLLADGANGALKPTGVVGRLIAGASKLQSTNKSVVIKPDVYPEDKTDLNLYGIDAYIVHTPGHTLGSISVVTAAGDALIGDLLLIKPFGFGRPSYPFFIDDLDAINKSVRMILDLQPAHLYAAHGGHLATEATRKWFLAKV
jgi:hydroxyacylglutathione hydrolase